MSGPAVAPDLATLRRFAGAFAVASALYPAGLLLGLASAESSTAPLARIGALLVLYGLLSAPSWLLILLHVLAVPARDSRFRQIVLLLGAVAFLALWLIWTPFILTATKDDALGVLSAFATPLCQLAVWLAAAAVLGARRFAGLREGEPPGEA